MADLAEILPIKLFRILRGAPEVRLRAICSDLYEDTLIGPYMMTLMLSQSGTYYVKLASQMGITWFEGNQEEQLQAIIQQHFIIHPRNVPGGF